MDQRATEQRDEAARHAAEATASAATMCAPGTSRIATALPHRSSIGGPD